MGSSKTQHRALQAPSTTLLSCASNVGDIILSGFLFGALNATIAPLFSMGPALSIHDIIASTPSMLLWSWCNLFLFCLHNQKQEATINEDKLNKSWRPIPAGRLTPEQATRLLYIMHPFCLIVGLTIGGLVPYAALTTFHVYYNEFGGADDGIMKNALNGVGVACFFAGPFEVATGHSVFAGQGDAAKWLLILAATFGTTSHTQDFRDVEGDAAAGRRTIPLMIGDIPARVVLTLGIIGWTEVACWYWTVGWMEHLFAVVAEAILIGNLFLCRSKEGDIRAWKLWYVAKEAGELQVER